MVPTLLNTIYTTYVQYTEAMQNDVDVVLLSKIHQFCFVQMVRKLAIVSDNVICSARQDSVVSTEFGRQE